MFNKLRNSKEKLLQNIVILCIQLFLKSTDIPLKNFKPLTCNSLCLLVNRILELDKTERDIQQIGKILSYN